MDMRELRNDSRPGFKRSQEHKSIRIRKIFTAREAGRACGVAANTPGKETGILYLNYINPFTVFYSYFSTISLDEEGGLLLLRSHRARRAFSILISDTPR